PDAGVAGRAEQLRAGVGAAQGANDRVLAPAGAYDQNPHRDLSGYSALVNSSAGIAAIVSLVVVPREPSSTETLAMVFSSGASTTLTKSYSPSVAHWLSTLTPSCSTSLLTSWTRPGLSFSVFTPFEVRWVSMMKTGICSSCSVDFAPRKRQTRGLRRLVPAGIA